MMDPELQTLITLFYEGVLAPNGWEHALDQLARFTGSRAATLIMWDRLRNRSAVGEYSGLTNEIQLEYAQTFESMDIAKNFVDKLPLGEWFIDERDLGHWTISRSPFYQEFLNKYDLGSLMSCPFLRNGSQLHGFLALSGSSGRRDMNQVVNRLAPLMPHLQQAARLRIRFDELGRQAAISTQVLDRFRFPLMVCNSASEVLLANQAAQAWLRCPDCPLGSRAHELARVRHIVHDACGLGKPASASGQQFRKIGGGTQTLVAVPLPATAGQSVRDWNVTEPMALLFVNDMAYNHRPDDVLLKQMFDLTPAEIRLLALLQNGLTLRETAQQLGISIETVRSHLKSVFSKLGIRRQVDLQRLLHDWNLIAHEVPGTRERAGSPLTR